MTLLLRASIHRFTQDSFNDKMKDAAAEVLCGAFEHDPLGSLAVGKRLEEDPSLWRAYFLAQLNASIIGGHAYGIFIDSPDPKNLAGVAAWFGPGEEFLSTEEQRAGGWNDVLGKFDPAITEWFMKTMLPQYHELTTTALGTGYKRNIQHLQTLAVKPSMQRSGLGTRLVRDMLNRTDADGMDTCLETSTDADLKFYATLGYVPKGETVFNAVGGQTFTMWALLREAPIKN